MKTFCTIKLFLNKTARLPLLTLCLLLGFTASGSAAAAVDMYLKIPDIEGESQADGREGEIDILSWSWGASNGVNQPGSARNTQMANVQDISFVHFFDSASTELIWAVLTGATLPEATLQVVRSGGGDRGGVPYIELRMRNARITSVSNGGSTGEDRLTESFSLNFEEICVTYFEQLPTGEVRMQKELCWDVARNRSL